MYSSEKLAEIGEKIPESVGEPHQAVFIHDGLCCNMRRNYHGAWCGYVKIPVTHRLYQKAKLAKAETAYSEVPEFREIDAHGGLTYSAICPVDEGLWLGFDCAHHTDKTIVFSSGIYRNFEYVIREVKWLAIQLKLLEADLS